MKNIALLTFLLSSNIMAQNVIVNSLNGKPISSVSVQYNKSKGVITNDDGYFKLPKEKNIDTIKISHLSYKGKSLVFKNLKPNDTIFLTPFTITLDEVVVKTFKAKDTIIKSIQKIDKNYLNIPYNSYGFFRQSLEENSKGVEMVEVDFMSFVKNNITATKIATAKRTNNYSEFRFETYGGVALVIQDGDFVRRKAYFLSIKEVDNYYYNYEGEINHQNLNIYKISFKPKDKNNLNYIRKGVLYVDAKSLAIVQLNYHYDTDKLSKIVSLSSNKKSNRKPLYTLKKVDNVIKYRKFLNEKWSLSFIKVINYRNGVFRKKENSYILTAKLVINNVSTKNTISLKRSNYNLSKDFNRAVKKYDKLESWGDTYKFPLSNREKQILKDINKQNKK